MQSKKSKNKRQVLGRGLASLLSSSEEITTKEYFLCNIDLISSNRYQPRTLFDKSALKELSLSIKKLGVLQPILVKKKNSGYELIAGERRLKASKIAGLTQIPVILKKSDDVRQLEIALIENIQRENLNPIEEYKAYKLLMQKFELTQEEVAKRIGKRRSTIANFLRLENLADEIKEIITTGQLTMGHAKAILSLEDKENQIKIANEVITKDLSVRATEKLVKEFNRGILTSPRKRQEKKAIPEAILKISYNLSKKLNSRVKIEVKKSNEGRIEIEFKNQEELERIVKFIEK